MAVLYSLCLFTIAFTCLKAAEPLQGFMLLLTTNSLGVPCADLISFEGWKAELTETT